MLLTDSIGALLLGYILYVCVKPTTRGFAQKVEDYALWLHSHSTSG